MRALRIGTRGSELALWQSQHVAHRLAALPGTPPSELVALKTEGDRNPELPLPRTEGKAFFTREIEEALFAGAIDLAVHSLKDLATATPDGLALVAVLARGDPRDALVVRRSSSLPRQGGIDALPSGARVGSSSLRRQALLARWRPDLVAVDLRGNVPTRLRRLDRLDPEEGGRFDALLLAAAGLERLGVDERIDAYLPTDRFLPAAGQGAIAVQARVDDTETRRWAELLDDRATRVATTAERALLGRLEGGCQVPVGTFAELLGERLTLSAIVCSLDGKSAVEGRLARSAVDAAAAAAIGEELADQLLRRGASEILAAIRAR